MNKIIQALGALKTWKFWKELVIMTVGMFIAAAAVNYFLVPSKLVIGSISGLSIVIGTAFGFSVPTVVTIINAILLIMAFILIGNEFGLKTVYTALILGPLMNVWEAICPAASITVTPESATVLGSTPSVMGNVWFDLLAFVLILSASQALMFSINASTGGLDILAKIVNKYFHFDIGTSVTVAGVAICCTAFFINDFRLVIAGLIGTWLNGLVVDHFMAGLSRRKRVCIISADHEVLRDYIVNHIGRGCSLYEVTGGYSGEKNVEIQSILTKDEFAAVMNFIKARGINAFITAGNVSEVYGLWFKHKRLKN